MSSVHPQQLALPNTISTATIAATLFLTPDGYVSYAQLEARGIGGELVAMRTFPRGNLMRQEEVVDQLVNALRESFLEHAEPF
jgi:hypothetical protein